LSHRVSMPFWLLLVVLLLRPLELSAQEASPPRVDSFGSNRAAEYFLGDENAIYIAVNVWGKVLRPGQYNVPSGTNLLTLLSAAGGPTGYSRLDNVRIVRMVNQREEILEVDIRKYLETGDFSLIPEIEPGDTVVVSGSAYNWFANAVDVAAKLGILLNAFVLMDRLK
jgi:polysaccharide export outer membrane protein